MNEKALDLSKGQRMYLEAQCKSKFHFVSEVDALFEITDDLVAYWCPLCDGWHRISETLRMLIGGVRELAYLRATEAPSRPRRAIL